MEKYIIEGQSLLKESLNYLCVYPNPYIEVHKRT